MKKTSYLILLIFIISFVKSLIIEEQKNLDNTLNLIYPVNVGPDEEERQFLIDPTRQNTYLFINDKITSNIDDDEFETNLEINTLHLKDFEFQLSPNILEKDENYGQ